jgi:hypothetical protein
MNALKNLLVLIFLISGFCAKAQETFSVSGIVKDAGGETLPAATIFLDGSEKKTYTNDKGEFILSGLSPGTYQLTVHFVGYKASKQNVIIQDKSAKVNVTLESSSTALKEVVITNSVSRNKYLQIFLKNFLGETDNGKSCIILNPEIIKFSEQSVFVIGKTYDFLEIENRNLGYRIKYLLRDFRINRATLIASYTGECIFEDLKGSEEEVNTWKENRKSAYLGSLMHFLRSLYRNNTDKEGFFFYPILSTTQEIDTRRWSAENIAEHPDSNFLAIKFSGRLYVVYNNQTDTASSGKIEEERITKALRDKTGSIIELYLKKATVDAKGSLVDYRSFLVRDFWGNRRMGDQLPFEYTPEEVKSR